MDRPRDGLWTVDVDDLEPAGRGRGFCPLGRDARRSHTSALRPTSWAHTTARLGAELERSLADESAGPLAHLLPLPEGHEVAEGEDGSDPYAAVRTAITAARGKFGACRRPPMGGAGRGKDQAPKRDWKAERIGPAPPDILAQLRADVFGHVLAATGMAPALSHGRRPGPRCETRCGHG